jgi:hypothetical protein
MHMIGSISWLSVLVAAVSTFIIGSLWYGPLFARAWMADSGMTREKGKSGNMPLIFGGSFVLNLVIASGIAVLLGANRSLLLGLHTGVFAALFFQATTLGIIYFYEMRPLRLWLINAGYQLVTFAVMGMIIGAWPR